MLLLAAYLALYPAIFALVVFRLRAAFGRSALWLAPAVWVTTELGRGLRVHRVSLGAAWLQPGAGAARGATRKRLRRVRVVVSRGAGQLRGVLGVLPDDPGAARSSRRRESAVGRQHVVSRRWPLALSLVLVAVTAGWGGLRLRANTLTREGAPVRVGLIQGNIAQDQKWNPARAGRSSHGTST